MSRRKTDMFTILCVALLAVSLPVLAQESAQQTSASPTTTATAKWEKVADGIWAVKIPRFPEDKKEDVKPEFAVLRLSEARYDEFQKNHVEFLNKHKIFSKAVNKQEVCSAAKPQKEKSEVQFWYTMFAHWPNSTAACQAYPGWSEPASSQ